MTTTTGRVPGLARAGAAAAVAALAVACAASAAEPRAEVIVEAPSITRLNERTAPLGATVEVASIRYRVRYADLNLATPAGVRALEARINDAARRACRQLEASRSPHAIPAADDPPCVKTAVDGAMKQAREAIAAARRKAAR